MSPTVLVLVFLIGCSLGLLGSGGSILLIPTLVYAGGIPPEDAVGLSLAVVSIAAAFGAWLHYRDGSYHARASLLFASSGSAGALAGSTLTGRVSPSLLMILLGSLMVAVAVSMLWKPAAPRFPRRCRIARCLAVGGGVGLITGFLGVGGGFLLVPAMVLFGGVDTRRAVGASLTVIAINSGVGFLGHLGSGGPDTVVTPLLAALSGMWVGTRFGRRLDAAVLQRVFAALVMAVGIALIVINAIGV